MMVDRRRPCARVVAKLPLRAPAGARLRVRPVAPSRLLAAVLLALAAGAGSGHADEARLGAEANPADARDPFAYAVNPSLAELTFDRVGVAYRLLHLNLLANASDLGTGGLVYAGRRSFGALAAGVATLRAPLSRETAATVGLGRWLGGGFIVGGRLGLFQRSFRAADLLVESQSDPLLQGSLTKTVPTLAVSGSWWRPDLGLTLAAVLENPHEPDASLAGDGTDPLRRTLRLGASWEKDAWHLAAAVARDGWRSRWSALGRGFIFGQHALALRFTDTEWRVAARIAVDERLWVEYGVAFPWSDLASEAAGTHGLVLCWHQAARPDPRGGGRSAAALATPAPRVAAPAEREGFLGEPVAEPLNRDFAVRAARDTVRLRVKRLRREFAPDVPRTQLARLPRWKAGVLDTTWSDRVTWSPPVAAAPVGATGAKPLGGYSDAYRTQVDDLAAWLREHPDKTVVVAAPEAQLARARYLAGRIAAAAGRDFAADSGVEIRVLPAGAPLRLRESIGVAALPAEEEITLREYDPLPFTVRRIRSGRSPTTSWSLEIRDSRGRLVRSLTGDGEPPAQVFWDWRDAAGRIVGIDRYTYRWGWTEADGGAYTEAERSLLVIREILQRTLRFGRDIASWRDRPDANPVLLLEDRPVSRDGPMDDGEPARHEGAGDSKQGAGE